MPTHYSYAETGYANPHAVTSVGGTTYAYDNNGNVTAIGSLDYTWDWRNRLASADAWAIVRAAVSQYYAEGSK